MKKTSSSGKRLESDTRIDELARENAALASLVAEKDKAAADSCKELATFRNIEQQAAAETGSQIAALREQVLSLLEKNEMLTVLSSEEHTKSDTRIDELARENTALAASVAGKDKAAADLQQELASSRELAQRTADETEAQLAALREQVLSLLEKNEMLTSMSSERRAEADTRIDELARESAALASIVAEKEKTVADLQDELARYKDM